MKKMYLVLIFILSLSSCNNYQKSSILEHVLMRAGANRSNLEKVLKHYKGDSLKFEAAKYLIINMPGSYSRNPEVQKVCQPFYDQYDSLMLTYKYKRNTIVDSLWTAFSSRSSFKTKNYIQADLQTITSTQLISEIDLAFMAWENNEFTKKCSFDEFCDYILPFNRSNGFIIDNSREILNSRHRNQYFTSTMKDIFVELDSLLNGYQYLKYSTFGSKLPIFTPATFERLKRGHCFQRCWYNSMLLSSLGIACAIDFVPAWGNRNNSHEWNVLINNKKNYAFGPFSINHRWKFNEIYNNQSIDSLWGKFRLPKVYRHTYKNYIEGPALDKRIHRNDIPPLFKNFKKKDVSSAYFETCNVKLNLVDVPKDTHYAYLCVFGYQSWHPVQWSSINNQAVTFADMGKDIVYLPAYYKKGKVVPAGEPFLLSKSGQICKLSGHKNDYQTVRVAHVKGAYAYRWNRKSINSLARAVLVGENDATHNLDTLCILPNKIPLESQSYELNSDNAYQKIMLLSKSSTMALSEIVLYNKEHEVSISNVLLCGNTKHSTDVLNDNDLTTSLKEIETDTLQIILDSVATLSKMRITPYLVNGLKVDKSYVLRYWDKGWVSLDTLKASENLSLYFTHVPKERLYMLQDLESLGSNKKSSERVFLYKNGEVLWY